MTLLGSLHRRLTGLLVLVASLTLVGMGVLTLVLIDEHFKTQDRDLLEGKVQLAGRLAERVTADADLTALATQLQDALIGHHDLHAILERHDGRVLLANQPILFPTDLQPVLQTWESGDNLWRGLAVPLKTAIKGQAPLRLWIALEISHHRHFLTQVTRTLALWVGLAVLASVGLAALAVRFGLRPLGTLQRQLDAISAGGLSRRVTSTDFPPELQPLAEALNRMLNRLDLAFQRLDAFSSDIAHELRTPLSNLLTQTQVALSQPRQADAYRDTLASNIEELERLARMISDMLFLAKTEQARTLPTRERLLLDQEVQAVFDFYEALAQDSGVQMRAQGQGEIRGDRPMVRRALGNLLSNALRYTPRGQTIDVQLAEDEDLTTLTVSNPGPAIPEAVLPHIFERFVRGEAARGRATPGHEGTGLGLSITRAIVEAHGGRIRAESGANGTRFTLTFPRGKPIPVDR